MAWGLPLLSGVKGDSLELRLLFRVLVISWNRLLDLTYSSTLPFAWEVLDQLREGGEVIDVWTDGSLVEDQVSGASSSGFWFSCTSAKKTLGPTQVGTSG